VKAGCAPLTLHKALICKGSALKNVMQFAYLPPGCLYTATEEMSLYGDSMEANTTQRPEQEYGYANITIKRFVESVADPKALRGTPARRGH
jgi:hypothetical protein